MSSDDKDLSILTKYRAALIQPMPSEVKGKILGGLFPRNESANSFWKWLWAGGGAVAACLAFFLCFHVGRLSVESSLDPDEEVVASHVRSLMVTHLYDVKSTDQHTVKPWFEGKLDFGPVVKDFAAQDFPLLGGRLDYIGGRTEAALVYGSSQHVINLFEHPTSFREQAPRFRTLRGFQIFSWSTAGMRYVAVSDLNARDLQRFVELWKN